MNGTEGFHFFLGGGTYPQTVSIVLLQPNFFLELLKMTTNVLSDMVASMSLKFHNVL